jgi:hypothetical protein
LIRSVRHKPLVGFSDDFALFAKRAGHHGYVGTALGGISE